MLKSVASPSLTLFRGTRYRSRRTTSITATMVSICHKQDLSIAYHEYRISNRSISMRSQTRHASALRLGTGPAIMRALEQWGSLSCLVTIRRRDRGFCQ